MGESLEFGPLEPDERGACREVLARSFSRDDRAEDVDKWFATLPQGDLRCVRRGGDVLAVLCRIPMGQFFGGRSVPTTGISVVGVAPHARGSGLAKALMSGALAEARAEGTALSTLYASTFSLYRSVGYERAGSRFVARVQLSELLPPERDRSVVVRPLEEGDEEAVRANWREWARRHPGNLDRGPYVQNRVLAPGRMPAHGVVFEVDGCVEGHVRWLQMDDEELPYSFQVQDHAALTPRAVNATLRFLADHRSLAGVASWASGPADPLLLALRERQFELAMRYQWMLRLAHLPNALEARGYPRGVEVRLDLDVRDDLLEENAGRWRVTVADGRASVERGGDGTLAADVRALASLYSGFASPDQLALVGGLEGDAASLERAAAAFAGPTPTMADMF